MSFAGTGISELNRLLGGGIRRGHSVLVQADVGTLHELFLFAFMEDGLNNGEYICYISLDRDIEAVTHMVQAASPSISKALGKTFFVVDLQTRQEIELSDAFKEGVLTVSDPSNPSLVSASVGSFLSKLNEKEKGVRFVANSISDAITTFGLTPTYQMIKELLVFAKRREFSGINIIYPKMHTRQENATIEHIHDGVIELSTAMVGSRLQKYLQVRSMTGAKFSSEIVPYEELDGRIALWTRLIEDFEAMKKGLTMEPDGTLRIMGAKGQFISERSLANLTSIILKEAGYEKGGNMLYEYTRASAGRTAEEISKVQRISGPEVLRTYLKVSQMTGSGVFTHISLDEATGTAIVHGVNLIPSTPKFDRQVHFRDAGAIAGVLEFVTGKPYKVEQVIPKFATNLNPVDLTGSASSDMFELATRILLEDPMVHALIVIGLHHVPGLREDFVDRIADVARGYTKPVVACDIGETEMAMYVRSRFDKQGIPSYSSPEDAARSMVALVKYGFYLKKERCYEDYLERFKA